MWFRSIALLSEVLRSRSRKSRNKISRRRKRTNYGSGSGSLPRKKVLEEKEVISTVI